MVSQAISKLLLADITLSIRRVLISHFHYSRRRRHAITVISQQSPLANAAVFGEIRHARKSIERRAHFRYGAVLLWATPPFYLLLSINIAEAAENSHRGQFCSFNIGLRARRFFFSYVACIMLIRRSMGRRRSASHHFTPRRDCSTGTCSAIPAADSIAAPRAITRHAHDSPSSMAFSVSARSMVISD